jgi:calcineurin-like phosphoesterase family protein
MTDYTKFENNWITSDIHFNHLNILKYNADTRGSFVDTDHMNEEIISRWNSTVSEKDHTFILGDIAMGDIAKAPARIKRLNGAKTLIKGNHDRSLMKQDISGLFVEIRDYLCFSYKKTGLVLFHYPIASFDGQSHGAIHFHGHLHGAPSGLTGRIKDIGMDTNELVPYNLDTLISKMKMIPLPVKDHHGK